MLGLDSKKMMEVQLLLREESECGEKNHVPWGMFTTEHHFLSPLVHDSVHFVCVSRLERSLLKNLMIYLSIQGHGSTGQGIAGLKVHRKSLPALGVLAKRDVFRSRKGACLDQ